MNAGGPMTRADYENGNDEESGISNVRFYLFTSSGAAYNCFTDDAENNVNYIDVTNSTFTEQTDGNSVEQISNAILVIPNGVQGQLPGKMVTVINNKTVPATMSLDNLKKQISDFGATGEDQFVMSNSTYGSGSNVVCETELTLNDFATTSADAEANPINVYVERVVAKVTPNITMTSTTTTGGSETIYKVYDDADDTKDVYIKIDGWALADENGKSYLCKQLSESYSNIGFTWTSTDYRSYWANSVAFSTENTKQNQAWTGINATLNGTTSLYTQENTPTAVVTEENLKKENDLTKFILAATLVKNDGTAITRITHRGVEYTDKNGLLAQIAQYQKTGSGSAYYVKEETGTYRLINSTDVEFKTAADLGTSITGLDSYRVYVQLKDGVKLYSDDKGTEANNETTFNANLRTQANSAMIWEGGQTYYYTAIPHLGSNGTIGQYGVVRNHVYQINITEIKGFGTPVYDNSETIVPVTPTDDASYLAAKVNVLAWKVVAKDVTLGGN